MNDRLTISSETMNKILGVLGSLPYTQVANLIQEVQSDVAPVEPSPEINIPNPGVES